MIALLDGLFRQRTRAAWCARLEAEDVPHAPMYDTREAMEDPQARHLQLEVSAPHPEGGEWRTIRSPVSFDGERPLEVTAPPTAGRGQRGHRRTDALRRSDALAHHPPARLHPRGRPAARRMDGRHRVPDRHRPDLRRQAPGVHPAVGHAGRLDDGGDARPAARRRPHRPSRRQDAAATRPPRPRCRAPTTGTARPTCRSAPTSRQACAASPPSTAAASPTPAASRWRRAARHLVGRRRGRVRHAGRRRRHGGARAHSHRRRRPLLVLVDQALVLPGAGRRPRGPHARRHGPPPQPARPHPHDGGGRRARAGDHAPLRGGQPLHRLGCGVRRAAQPGRRLRIAPAGKAPDGRAIERPYWSAHYDFHLQPEAA
jgi:hypothetical protein